VKHLAKYLLERMIVDFENIDLEEVRGLLREEGTQESRALLAKLVEERGLDELAITLADCLKENIRTGVDEASIEDQLVTYSES
jgi:carbamoylphosphate synthase small subunit